jgi:dienelactone hydrolase
MPTPRSLLFVLALAACAGDAGATTTVRVAAWACNTQVDRIFRNGLEADEAIPSDPSHGSGGEAPGNPELTYAIAGLGSGEQVAYVYVPDRYSPSRAWPVVLALHGAAGSPYWADEAARSVRGTWQDYANAYGFLVVAPVANGAQGSWIEPPGANDYAFVETVLNDVAARYNVDRARQYLWGFSAGGHVAHDLMVNDRQPGIGRNRFAAYAASAGRLFAVACRNLSESACQTRLNTLPRKVPFDLHLGDQDPMMQAPYDADLDPGRLQTAGWVPGDTLNYVVFPGIHEYTSGNLSQIWQFMCRFAAAP